jgi:DNA modification methylase
MLPLQIWLIERYSKHGDTILDPMSGSGTLLIACTMGRNVICVELEKKFCDMQQANWKKIQTFGAEMGYSLGWAKIIQGDARRLPDILCDVVISSPPYEEAMGNKHHSPRADKLAQEKANPVTYTDKADVVITSPPYEAQKSGNSVDNTVKRINEGKYKGKRPDVWLSKGNIAGYTFGNGYSQSQENIGNLRGRAYLDNMLLVYKGCHAVLKDGGLLCLVTKNYIRNKQVQRLDLDTIKLCEQAGFELIERHERKLTAQSFWRTIYAQKFPDVPQIDTEDILILRKL